MKIRVNGEDHEFDEGGSLQQLIEQLGMGQGRIAVERNREIVPRSLYAETLLKDSDSLEIVQAIGGG